MKVAILGATSHIAKNLITFFHKDPSYELYLFARNAEAVREFFKTTTDVSISKVLGFNAFPFGDYDAIINCVGIADPRKQRNAGLEIFLLTERFDNLVLDYLKEHKDTIYINLSSGAVYGTAFDSGVTKDSVTTITVNEIKPADYYRIAKLNAEAKHRAMVDRAIIDLRVFSFFSRFIDLESGFLLCEMMRCVKSNTVFYTNGIDIVRDYVAPSDLFALIDLCIKRRKDNVALDVYSAKPVRKSELTGLFANEFGLSIEIVNNGHTSATGTKYAYYSSNFTASSIIGYSPNKTSLETVRNEALLLLADCRNT